jgi:Sec-independent protein secretion pathway component TatC
MTEKGRDLNRELIELLNELRVALPGVQVLFAFLLIVPFSQGFPQVSGVDRAAYFLAFVFASAACAFLIAPSAYHRIQFREHDKKHLLELANRFAIVGMAFLALAMGSVTFLITDVLFGSPWAAIATSVTAAVYAGVWFVLPLIRHVRH